VRFACSKLGGWLILNVTTYLDPPLNRLTRGRFSFATFVGLPFTLLTTTGAKSGHKRTVPLAYFMDGDRVILIASSAGKPRHPGWYHNLIANPEATLTIRGRARTYIAREAQGEERQRLWQRANEFYPGYAVYQTRARGRIIPIMVLSPKSEIAQPANYFTQA
jgi:deazaflavin-dependent oxidoreductase (nitroreductase family)